MLWVLFRGFGADRSLPLPLETAAGQGCRWIDKAENVAAHHFFNFDSRSRAWIGYGGKEAALHVRRSGAFPNCVRKVAIRPECMFHKRRFTSFADRLGQYDIVGFGL